MNNKTLKGLLAGFLIGVGLYALYTGITGSNGISWVSLIIVIVLIGALTKKKAEDKE